MKVEKRWKSENFSSSRILTLCSWIMFLGRCAPLSRQITLTQIFPLSVPQIPVSRFNQYFNASLSVTHCFHSNNLFRGRKGSLSFFFHPMWLMKTSRDEIKRTSRWREDEEKSWEFAISSYWWTIRKIFCFDYHKKWSPSHFSLNSRASMLPTHWLTHHPGSVWFLLGF